METTLRIARLDGKGELVIRHADWLAEFFFRNDPSSTARGSYDNYIPSSPPNRIVPEDIGVINRTMAARTPIARWMPLIDQGDLPWLQLIDRQWDLLTTPDAEWQEMRCPELIAGAIAGSVGTGRGPSIATKILHMKRPRLFPVCDDLVIRQIGGRNDSRDTAAAIAHLRLEGRRNLDQLMKVRDHLHACGPPFEPTLVRIFDALLWASYPNLRPYAQFAMTLDRALGKTSDS